VPRRVKAVSAELVTIEESQLAYPVNATEQDEKLVEKAAKHIRGILARTVARGLEEVGGYLLDTFYNGDPKAYQSLRPGKHASLSLLEARCETLELPVSRTFLANAIGVAVMARQLPETSSFLRLPPSHKQELLRVSTPERVESLATTALESKLTVQKLREMVREEREKGKRTTQGRKAKPKAIRVLSACSRLLHDPTSGRPVLKKGDFSALTPTEVAEVKELREKIQKRLEEVRKMVEPA